MPKVSKASAANQQDIGIGQTSDEVVEGYEISFLDIREASDLAPLLKGLPDDRCPCPHWGYVVKGRVTFTFADHAETFEAGDAFYVAPGHTPAVDAATEWLIFSPAEQAAEVTAVVERNVQAMQSA
jgi:hypothetical protein